VTSLEGRRFFSRHDALSIICIALVLSVLRFYSAGDAEGQGAFAEISVDCRVVETMPFGVNAEYSPEGMPSVRIAIRGMSVGFLGSDCPDKTCVHTGFLSKPGQSAACLPNRVVVRVSAGGGEELDSTVY
jgi:hypothetical protein